MQILYDEQIQINASLEKVWEALCTSDQRSKWQEGVQSAKLLYGSEGYRGAKTELVLKNSGKKIVEHVHRSRPFERLQTQFQLGDCSYQQIVYLSRTDEDHTLLTYHCKQELSGGWRRVLNIRPSIPECVKPSIFISMANYLEKTTSAA